MSLTWKSVFTVGVHCNLKTILGLGYDDNGNFACARFQLRRFHDHLPTKNGVVISMNETKLLYDYFKAVVEKNSFDNIECGDFSISRPATDEIRIIKKDKLCIITCDEAQKTKVYLPAFILIMNSIRGNHYNEISLIEKVMDCYIYNVIKKSRDLDDFVHEKCIHKIADNHEQHVLKLRRIVFNQLDMIEHDFKAKFKTRVNMPNSMKVLNMIEAGTAVDLVSIANFLDQIIPTFNASF